MGDFRLVAHSLMAFSGRIDYRSRTFHFQAVLSSVVPGCHAEIDRLPEQGHEWTLIFWTLIFPSFP